jgi:deoxyribodipyrimidine photo-lyase
MSVELFWHRRDPRTHDNAGLAAATRAGTTVPVFVYDRDLLQTIGGRQRALYLRSVKRLQDRYRELGSDLVVRAGSPEDVLPNLAAEFDADTVYYNEHYRPARRNRERAVTDAFAGTDVATDARTDLVLVDPERLDRTYPNHSQFHDDWQTVPKRPPSDEPDADALADVTDAKTVPEPDADVDLPTAGYRGARERLDAFAQTGLLSYNDTRDDLSAAVDRPTQAVSRMSPYVAVGAIGIREVYGVASEVYESTHGSERRNVDKYRYELSWREQNYHLLYYNPDLAVSNYKSFPNEIAWRNDDDDFEAWRRGETGYPLVDAGMRQLQQEGYVHNRPRQVVASFLTKHLLVDWRKGAREFTRQLLDHDYASNYGNWQWTASTGTDSVDVRIFDPVSQASKYDDDAHYVKQYIPELSDVPAGKVIDWPTLSKSERDRLAPDYPDPIVDRNHGYERAQRVFEEALGKR